MHGHYRHKHNRHFTSSWSSTVAVPPSNSILTVGSWLCLAASTTRLGATAYQHTVQQDKEYCNRGSWYIETHQCCTSLNWDLLTYLSLMSMLQQGSDIILLFTHCGLHLMGFSYKPVGNGMKVITKWISLYIYKQIDRYTPTMTQNHPTRNLLKGCHTVTHLCYIRT